MKYLPTDFVGNVIVPCSGSPVAVFRLVGPAGMSSYRYQSDDRVAEHARRIEGLVRSFPLQATIISVAEPLSVDQVRSAISNAPLASSADHITSGKLDGIDRMAALSGERLLRTPGVTRHHFLWVSLDERNGSIIDRVLGELNRRPVPSPKRERELLKAADLVYAALDSELVFPATAKELTWVWERATARGLAVHPRYPISGKQNSRADREYRSGTFLLDGSFAEGQRSRSGVPKDRHVLAVGSPAGVSYQTTLVVSQLPRQWTFPAVGYWVAAAEDFDFPVDVTMVVRSPDHGKTAKRYLDRHKDLVGQPEQYSGVVTGVPQVVYDAIDQSNRAQSLLESSASRIHQVTLAFIVAADSVELLNARIAHVKKELANYDCVTHIPTGDQLEFFLAGLPGTTTRSFGGPSDYVHELTGAAVASLFPGFSPQLGNAEGMPVGRRADLGSFQPVYLSPSRDTSPSTIGIGLTGAGKSWTAKTIAYGRLSSGAQVIAIDRSTNGEYTTFARHLPEAITTAVVDLLDGSWSLCPLSVFREDVDHAISVTTSFLSLLAGIAVRSAEHAVIAQAVEEVAAGGGVTANVLDHLQVGDQDEQAMYHRINILARTRFARLAFSDGEPVNSNNADLMVLHARGLVLPDKDKVLQNQDLSADEAASIAMTFLLMAVADQLCMDRSRLSEVILDEAWAFLSSAFGRNLASQFLRDGRKDGKAISQWSQSPGDIPDELAAMASTIVVTKQAPRSGAAALRLINAAVTPANIELVENLPLGHVLLRDENGDIGLVKIEIPDNELEQGFNTKLSYETADPYAKDLSQPEPEPITAPRQHRPDRPKHATHKPAPAAVVFDVDGYIGVQPS